MSNTSQQSPDNRPRKDKLPFPQRDIMTSNQIQNLVQIGSFALHSLTYNQGVEPHQKTELDGGCKSSAEAIFIKVCDKLDDILSDTDRWNFNVQETLENKLEKMYDQNLEFLLEQTKAARQVNTPHFCYKPTLLKLPVTGEWIAYIGSLEDVEHSIVGIGNTPANALESFDSLFKGEPLPEHLLAWLAERDMRENKEQNDKINTVERK